MACGVRHSGPESGRGQRRARNAHHTCHIQHGHLPAWAIECSPEGGSAACGARCAQSVGWAVHPQKTCEWGDMFFVVVVSDISLLALAGISVYPLLSALYFFIFFLLHFCCCSFVINNFSAIVCIFILVSFVSIGKCTDQFLINRLNPSICGPSSATVNHQSIS